ncbi:hypothetical protein BGZ98_003732 [Dissophora globulifera]|nr:hypothetical protein BGZ98_003732 [Dissophora globulifera]
MVVELGDTIRINDFAKSVGDRKAVKWSQNHISRSVEFIFMPFLCPKDNSAGFVAIEFGRLEDFKKLCTEIPANPDVWEENAITNTLTVTNEFKYGAGEQYGSTIRFLVFLCSSYKPYQHRFTMVDEKINGPLGEYYLSNKEKMVAEFGDTIRISDFKTVGDRRVVEWEQNLMSRAVEFVFMPYHCPKDNSGGFIAIEFGRFDDFKKLCTEIPGNPDVWDENLTTNRFTITNEFKYGASKSFGSPFRFLVYMDSSYKPFQHRFTIVHDKLNGINRPHTYLSLAGDDLHYF